MKIDRRTSLQIEALRFPLIVGIVFIHMGANYSDLIVNSTASSLFMFRFVIHLISFVVLSSAVPLFFVISAYLFFVGFKPTYDSYVGKLKSRIVTLFIPYLIWNLSYLLFKLIIQTNQMVAAIIGGTSKRIADYQFFDYYDALSGMTNFPISYQFWFIRDLMIMVCLAPIVWWAIKKFSWLLVICFMIIWTIDLERIANIHNESWLFFSIGCLIAQKNFDIQISQGLQYRLLIAYAILACMIAGFYVAGVHLLPVFGKLATLVGVAGIWYASSLIFKRNKINDFVIRMSAYSFFIFAAHEPLLGIVAKVIRKLSWDQWGVTAFALYFVVPIFTIALLCGLGVILKLKTPWFYRRITGGR